MAKLLPRRRTPAAAGVVDPLADARGSVLALRAAVQANSGVAGRYFAVQSRTSITPCRDTGA